MNLLVLDKEFISIAYIEKFISFLWNDRFNEAGDFELYLPAGAYDQSYFSIGNYIWTSLSPNRLMIIETVNCETGSEDGDFLTISGRSLESILARRVIDIETDLTGSLQDGIERLLNEHVINPSDPKRQIPNITFKKSDDPRITELTTENVYSGGENLYDVIQEMLSANKIGMKMLRDNENQFIFELYMGVDRSYKQEELPWVVFSHEYENLISSEYNESILDYKNQIIVVGQYDEPPEENEGDDTDIGEGGDVEIKPSTPIVEKEPIPIRIEVGDNSGLDRFEYYVDARDITSQVMPDEDDPDAEEIYLTEDEFREKLIERGNEELENHKKEIEFDAEVDYTHQFKMGIDYFLGDILQVSNNYGNECSLRVNEYIISIDQSGEQHYPKFVNPEKEDETK